MASSRDRFVLFAQPIIHLGSGRVSHHELLLRIELRQGYLFGKPEPLAPA